MPVPSNISFATAINITSLPYSNAQQVDDAGTTYTVYYKYTATFDGVIGVWAFGDLVTYNARLFVYSPDTATVYLNFQDIRNKPILFPVVNGVTYYFQIAPIGNPTPANLTFSVLAAPTTSVQIGDIFVTGDDATDVEFWAAILDKDTDNTVRRFTDANSPGEQGQILENGRYVLSEDNNFDAQFYDSNFNLVTTYSPTTDDVLTIGISKVLQKFYIAHHVIATNDFEVLEYEGDGTATGRSWTLAGIASLRSIAVNADATILYFARGGESAIKRWDLTTDLALSDLVADTPNYDATDLMYLEDNTILMCLLKTAGGVDVEVRQYNITTGATITTKNYGANSQGSGAPPRIAFSLTSPTDYWIWIKRTTTPQTSKFFKTRISDGVALTDRTHVIYQVGIYSGTATATPEGRFGSSHSCTFLILRVAATNRASGSGLYFLTQPNISGGITPTKTDDSYVDADGVTQDVAIPNPYVESYLSPGEE